MAPREALVCIGHVSVSSASTNPLTPNVAAVMRFIESRSSWGASRSTSVQWKSSNRSGPFGTQTRQLKKADGVPSGNMNGIASAATFGNSCPTCGVNSASTRSCPSSKRSSSWSTMSGERPGGGMIRSLSMEDRFATFLPFIALT
jgi:hypothetical protein